MPARPAQRAARTRRSLLSLSLAGASILGPGLRPADGRTPPGARTAAAASHLRVTQVEYRLELSQQTIRAGAVDLAEIDGGRIPHDLRLRRIGSSSTINGRLLTPGQRWEGVVYLSPGTYRLWCSLPEHARLGMHTTLRVTG